MSFLQLVAEKKTPKTVQLWRNQVVVLLLQEILKILWEQAVLGSLTISSVLPPGICHSEYISFWIFVILNICHSEYLSFWIFVILNICYYEYLSFWIFVILNICHSEYLSFWIFARSSSHRRTQQNWMHVASIFVSVWWLKTLATFNTWSNSILSYYLKKSVKDLVMFGSKSIYLKESLIKEDQRRRSYKNFVSLSWITC